MYQKKKGSNIIPSHGEVYSIDKFGAFKLELDSPRTCVQDSITTNMFELTCWQENKIDNVFELHCWLKNGRALTHF